MKEWTEPQLTILIRGKQEEAVLLSCKQLRAGAGADNEDSGCGRGGGAACIAACSAQASS